MSGQKLQDNTKFLLVKALKQCIVDKPIAQVSISELTRTAGINRKTFYYHFDSIRELCLWAYKADALEQARTANFSDAKQTLTNGFAYMQKSEEDRLFYTRLYEYFDLETLLQQTLHTEELQFMQQEIIKMARERNLHILEEDRRFLSEFFVEAYALMAAHYFRKERSWSAEELAQNLAIIWDAAVPAVLNAYVKKREQGTSVWKTDSFRPK